MGESRILENSVQREVEKPESTPSSPESAPSSPESTPSSPESTIIEMDGEWLDEDAYPKSQRTQILENSVQREAEKPSMEMEMEYANGDGEAEYEEWLVKGKRSGTVFEPKNTANEGCHILRDLLQMDIGLSHSHIREKNTDRKLEALGNIAVGCSKGLQLGYKL
jgi:hypothetical protein